MKKTVFQKASSVVLASALLFSSCASRTMIQSSPNGAKVYLDGESVGVTPYSHSDTKIVGSTTSVRIEKEGYETYNTSFSRNEQADIGAIIGGLFIWVPFLWTMKYKPARNYELSPIIDNQTTTALEAKEITKTSVSSLRELKQLLDEEIITNEEYEAEKKRILGN